MDNDDLERRRALFNERIAAHEAALPRYGEVWGWWRSWLLGHGGVEVVPPIDPEIRIVDLLQRAVVQSGVGAVSVPGEPSRCHENVETLVDRGRTVDGHVVVAGWTGYALSDDGLWRQHSWAVGDDGSVIETTEPRRCYAGVQWCYVER